LLGCKGGSSEPLEPPLATGLYNSIQLIDRDGRSLVNYRKLHPWIDEEVFTAGNEYTEVVECRGMKIGLLICYDVEFLESVRTLALQGAQLVAVPTAINLEYYSANIVSKLIPTHAMETVFMLHM